MKKLSLKDKAHLQETAKEFLEALRQEVESCILLEDVERLGRLVTQVGILLGYEVIETLRAKGFSKELTELSVKAGELRKVVEE